MILFPPAKINLGLHVLKKRSDGYHDISTCMAPIPIHDILELIPNYPEELKLSGIPVMGATNENLCWRAYQLMRSDFKIPETYIHLIKQIPMGAGLGGGSADAAFVLLALNDLYELGLSKNQLRDYAARLGSDCPFFIEPIPQMATGRGEILHPIHLDLSAYHIKLVNPGVHISTSEAYSGVDLDQDLPSIQEVLSLPIESWRGTLVNSFEKHIFERHPLLESIKNKLYEEGAVYAAMSGSGSTIFGIYREQPQASFSDFYERIGDFNS